MVYVGDDQWGWLMMGLCCYAAVLRYWHHTLQHSSTWCTHNDIVQQYTHDDVDHMMTFPTQESTIESPFPCSRRHLHEYR